MTAALFSDANASTVSSAHSNIQSDTRPDTQPESQPSCPLPNTVASGNIPDDPTLAFLGGQIRHLIFGTLGDVRHGIAHLHKLGYADPHDWSRPISTGRSNEVMATLTKRIRSK